MFEIRKTQLFIQWLDGLVDVRQELGYWQELGGWQKEMQGM
jgi:hypothetical protein